MIGDRNNITSEEDDSPSPPLSTIGKPKEWSFPGGLWEHRERCHRLRLGVGAWTIEIEESSIIGAGGSDIVLESITDTVLKPKSCINWGN